MRKLSTVMEDGTKRPASPHYRGVKERAASCSALASDSWWVGVPRGEWSKVAQKEAVRMIEQSAGPNYTPREAGL